MKARIRVGDRVEIEEGHYWPHGKLGTVIRKDPIIAGKRIVSHWFLILQDPGDDPRYYGQPSPLLFTRSQITLLPRRPTVVEGGEGDQLVRGTDPAAGPPPVE